MPNATKVEWLTRETAMHQLGMKDRRLRDYISAGKIKVQDGMLHAGDVARVQAERDDKKTVAQVRALSTMDPQVRQETKLAHTRALLLGAAGGTQLQGGNAAIAPLPDRPWKNLAEAEEYTGLPASTLRSLIEMGELPARDVGVRAGGRWRVKRADLDALEGVTQGRESRSDDTG